MLSRNIGHTQITPETSFAIDVVRLFAALVVFILHVCLVLNWFPITFDTFAKMGHTAVVIFFVLSGYVIAYTTTTKKRSAHQYANARLSRLCSIVLPALALSLICESLVWAIDTKTYLDYTRGSSIIRYLMAGTFTNELWFFSSAPPINIPLWSLSFEAWFYIIFGIWFYRIKQNIWSYIIITLICLLAGPKILLMMPLWLAGYFAYKLPKIKLTQFTSRFLAILFFAIALILMMYLPETPNVIGSAPFYYANQFVTDWIIGFCFSIMFWFLPLSKRPKEASLHIRNFRKIADLTFPIYVLHFPLLVLWKAIFPKELVHDVGLLLPILTILILCGLMGAALEKQRKYWDRLFDWLLGKLVLLKPQKRI